MGVPCGIMDQTASACSTEGHALHLDCRDLSIRQVPFDLPAARASSSSSSTPASSTRWATVRTRSGARAARRAPAQLGVPHLRDVPVRGTARGTRRLADVPTSGSVRYVRHVVSRRPPRRAGHRPARRGGRARRSARSSPRATPPCGTTCGSPAPELDLVVATANEAGALGARMTGVGSAVRRSSWWSLRTRTRSPRRWRRRSRRRASRRRGCSGGASEGARRVG